MRICIQSKLRLFEAELRDASGRPRLTGLEGELARAI